MRKAKSYSIVDHELLHGGYLERLSHEAMVLYLFLVVVGDREGRSFYREDTIQGILRLTVGELMAARAELIREGLIEYSRPYWWVTTIKGGKGYGGDRPKDTLSAGGQAVEFPADRGADRDFSKACIKDISEVLSGKGDKTGW